MNKERSILWNVFFSDLLLFLFPSIEDHIFSLADANPTYQILPSVWKNEDWAGMVIWNFWKHVIQGQYHTRYNQSL